MYIDNLTQLRQQLRENGLETERVDIVKNGVTCVGLRVITEGSISPIIYYSQQDSLEHFMERVRDAMDNLPKISIDVLRDREYVKKHLYISVQRKSNDDNIIKRDILNAEGYLRISLKTGSDNETGSVKVTRDILNEVVGGIDEETAWNYAISNMRDSFYVRGLSETLGMFGFNQKDTSDLFYVCTRPNGMDGTAALFYPEVFREFCERHSQKSVIILLSSTHELLLIPEEGALVSHNYKDFAAMVSEVNQVEVEPSIRMDPVCYRFSMTKDTEAIEIVGEV